MIKQNQKPCKGRREAKGLGCGNVGIYNSFHKGLCPACWADFLINTEAGQRRMKKAAIQAKKEAKERRKEERVKIMSVNEYRSKKVQPIINEIARLIDYGQPCIATGYTSGKINGGHYYSIGANPNLALNLHNIHLQSEYSNQYKGGQAREYFQGLISTYGSEYSMKVSDLKRVYKDRTISKQELLEVYPKALRVRRWLRKNKEKRTPEQRIRLRIIINNYLGLYPGQKQKAWKV